MFFWPVEVPPTTCFQCEESIRQPLRHNSGSGSQGCRLQGYFFIRSRTRGDSMAPHRGVPMEPGSGGASNMPVLYVDCHLVRKFYANRPAKHGVLLGSVAGSKCTGKNYTGRVRRCFWVQVLGPSFAQVSTATPESPSFESLLSKAVKILATLQSLWSKTVKI